MPSWPEVESRRDPIGKGQHADRSDAPICNVTDPRRSGTPSTPTANVSSQVAELLLGEPKHLDYATGRALFSAPLGRILRPLEGNDRAGAVVELAYRD